MTIFWPVYKQVIRSIFNIFINVSSKTCVKYKGIHYSHALFSQKEYLFIHEWCFEDTTNRFFSITRNFLGLLHLSRHQRSLLSLLICLLSVTHGIMAQEYVYMRKLNTAWWWHQMETFSLLLALCAGNSPVTGEFPAQRPVTQSFDVSLDLRLNKQLRKQSWDWWFEMPSRSLWRHHNDAEPI